MVFCIISACTTTKQVEPDVQVSTECAPNSWNDITASKKNIVIYTIATCPYCIKAKKLLRDHAINYREVDVSNDPATRLWLYEKTGQSTVPQIFFEDRSIGGHSDLLTLVAQPSRPVLLCSHQPSAQKSAK
ncbi:MAG: glutaredoxin domain-containing protein [Myxococcota bacterium]